jgi:dipeptidase D
MDIDKGRGNANKWMARIIWELMQQQELHLHAFDGGSLRNAIPREATAVLSCSDKPLFEAKLKEIVSDLKNEYHSVEPHFEISATTIACPEKAMSTSDLKKIIQTLCSVHNGVFRMSPAIEGLVEASSSLARVIIKDGVFTTQSLQRSSVESTKREVSMALACAFENMGATVEQSGDYPGWQPNMQSPILNTMTNLYRSLFHEEPKVKACHAGLECGLLGEKLPGVDMISFGPNIRAAHSPDEKVQISSVQKFWQYFLASLQQIPNA